MELLKWMLTGFISCLITVMICEYINRHLHDQLSQYKKDLAKVTTEHGILLLNYERLSITNTELYKRIGEYESILNVKQAANERSDK